MQSLDLQSNINSESRDIYLSNSLCGAVSPLTHASLSKRGFAAVWRLLALGAPKKAVRDPCLSFFGVEEDTAAEIEDVAFLLALMVDEKTVKRVKFLIDGKLHAPISGLASCINHAE